MEQAYDVSAADLRKAHLKAYDVSAVDLTKGHFAFAGLVTSKLFGWY